VRAALNEVRAARFATRPEVQRALRAYHVDQAKGIARESDAPDLLERRLEKLQGS
jgi:hypothetical protein